jgi:hypothetical protein
MEDRYAELVQRNHKLLAAAQEVRKHARNMSSWAQKMRAVARADRSHSIPPYPRPGQIAVIPMPDSVIQRLYDSEINFRVSCFYDDGFHVELGDNLNGIRAEAADLGRCERMAGGHGACPFPDQCARARKLTLSPSRRHVPRGRRSRFPAPHPH